MPDTDKGVMAEGVDEAERLFGQLRNQLLSLAHDCAKHDEGNWDEAERFFSLSRRVDHLRKELSVETPKLPFFGSGKGRGHSLETPLDAPSPRRKSKKDYPKYAIRSDVLIKTGLSRDQRTEYEHAIPKPEFDAVVKRLNELASRKHFVAEDVLGKVQCPSYQAYLVLSLLKERGLLAIPRRGFYAVRHPKQFASDIQEIWESLAGDNI